jgi:hypothetical protein
MATTVLNLISRALREINVIAETQTASAEQGTQCLEKLNDMLALWKTEDIDFGWYEQSSTSGNAPITEQARPAIVSNLAIACASQYGASVSAELARVADYTKRRLLTLALQDNLDNVDMSHMARGLGKSQNGYDITTDR